MTPDRALVPGRAVTPCRLLITPGRLVTELPERTPGRAVERPGLRVKLRASLPDRGTIVRVADRFEATPERVDDPILEPMLGRRICVDGMRLICGDRLRDRLGEKVCDRGAAREIEVRGADRERDDRGADLEIELLGMDRPMDDRDMDRPTDDRGADREMRGEERTADRDPPDRMAERDPERACRLRCASTSTGYISPRIRAATV